MMKWQCIPTCAIVVLIDLNKLFWKEKIDEKHLKCNKIILKKETGGQKKKIDPFFLMPTIFYTGLMSVEISLADF